MLVLSRHCDESICVGENVTVTIVAIRGDKVRVGLSAPKAIEIDRAEVRAAKDRERLGNVRPCCPTCGKATP